MEASRTDIASFNKLFKKYQEPFTLFAKSYVRDVMVAEDIYMDSMLQYWEKCKELPEDTNMPAYILTIVKNKSLNYLRHLSVEQEAQNRLSAISQREIDVNIMSLEACDPAELFATDIQKIVDATLDQMPANTKEVFTLSRFTHLTNKDIALQLNMTEKGVEYHMSKALKVLKLALKDYLPLLLFILLFKSK